MLDISFRINKSKQQGYIGISSDLREITNLNFKIMLLLICLLVACSNWKPLQSRIFQHFWPIYCLIISLSMKSSLSCIFYNKMYCLYICPVMAMELRNSLLKYMASSSVSVCRLSNKCNQLQHQAHQSIRSEFSKLKLKRESLVGICVSLS